MGRLNDGLNLVAGRVVAPAFERIDRVFARLPLRADERYLGGVAGGVARSLDVDPMIVRLGFAVGALYLPVVSVVYTLGWVLMPDERTGRSLVQSTREPNGWRFLVGVLALGIGATILVPDLGPGGNTDLTAGVVLLGLGLLLVLRHPNGLGRGGVVDVDRDRDRNDLGPGAGAADADPEGPVAAGGGAAAERSGSLLGRVRRDRVPPSYLGWLAISLVALLAGGLAAVDYNWSVKPGVAVSLALLVVGGALLVATRWGRARLLIPLGLLLLVLWAAVVVPDVPRYDGEGNVSYSLSSGDTLPGAYEHGYGTMEVDVRRGRFEAGDRQVLHIGLTSGMVRLTVPRDVYVEVRGEVGAGEVEIWDEWRVADSGPLFAQTVDLDAGDHEASRLNVVLDVGIGRVEVHRG